MVLQYPLHNNHGTRFLVFSRSKAPPNKQMDKRIACEISEPSQIQSMQLGVVGHDDHETFDTSPPSPLEGIMRFLLLIAFLVAMLQR